MRARVIDPATGAVREANIFVAVLGASNYTYARGHLDPGAGGLDRRARALFYLLRRGAGSGGAGQFTRRRRQGTPV